MNPPHSLDFQWTPFGVVAGALAVLGAAILGWIAWRRSGFARGTGTLEGMRLLTVLAVAATLNQPEWREQYLPDERPTVAVLWDASRSMDTRDVIDPFQPAEPPKSRREWIRPLVESEHWMRAEEHLDIVVEPFSYAGSASSDPPPPSSAQSPPPESREGTDLHAALTGALERHQNLRGVVLLSDGDWNVGDPPARAASRLRMKGVPVFVVGAGSESRLPDIELVRLDVPTFGVAGKPMRIPFQIESALPRDHRATVTLQPSSGKEVTTEVLVPAMRRVNNSILWRPEEVGDLTLTMKVTPSEGELTEENNERTVPIAIREETLKVLLVESRPRWEYRYLRNALERDPGVEVSCLLFHPGLAKAGGGKGYLAVFPDAPEELARYDVVFIGDVGVGDGELTLRQCEMIKGLVESQASGLILMPGLRGRHHSLMTTELAELYPVVLDAAQPRGWGSREPARFELTETGRRSLLTKLEDDEDENARLWEILPGFQWYAAVLRAKAGAEVLATHKNETSSFGRIPLLVTRTFGTGKVLFMGTDGAWRWREGVEDRYHYRFWGQVARWMAYQRNMAQGKSMRLFYAPDRPRSEDVVTLHANVMSADGEPLEDGTVVVELTAPSGKIESVRLAPSGDGWGLFTGRFSPKEHGRYRMTLRAQENPSSVETTLSVESVTRERIGRPARFDVLEEIATISRGRMVEPSEISGLVDEIAALSEPEPLVRRLRIWCHPLWAGCIVTMLGVLWVGRKMIGAI